MSFCARCVLWLVCFCDWCVFVIGVFLSCREAVVAEGSCATEA